MLFQSAESSLLLEVLRYEFPADGGAPDSDDRNWLMLRGTYRESGNTPVVDSNACLLTYELRAMTAGLKVLSAGVKDFYESDFTEPYLELSARAADGGTFALEVSFALPNTMEDVDTAQVSCTMTRAELNTLLAELDRLCRKYPDRT